MVGFLKDQNTLDTVDICISLESIKNSKKNQRKKFLVSISGGDSRTGGSIQYMVSGLLSVSNWSSCNSLSFLGKIQANHT